MIFGGQIARPLLSLADRTTLMLAFRRLERLEASRSFRLVVLALSAGVFAFSLYLVWLAFSNPLELEIREGSIWLLALAKRAGVDLYDTSRVAFVNMNHGPLDPIVKGWIARLWPGLPGHVVTRAFVLLCPVFLLGAAYFITERHLAAAMLAAGALFLFFCHMSWMIYVGRSDATALCGVAVCGALAHRLLVSRRNWADRRYVATQIGLGAASAAVFLTSWRYAPVVGALQVVVLSSQVCRPDVLGELAVGLTNRPRRTLAARLLEAAKHLAISTGLYLAGFALIWTSVFLFELHGDFHLYYRHFFGFFSRDSGWGWFPGNKYNLVPLEVLQSRVASVLLFVALILAGLYRLRQQRAELVAWLVMLLAAWITVSYGYFKNQGGGGMHYFFEFFVFAWIFVLHAFCRGPRWGAVPQLLLVLLVVAVLPRQDLLDQSKMLRDVRAEARTFRRNVDRRTDGRRIFGEETHLFKERYHGERVDTGDTDAAIATSGYFGQAFTRTYQAYTRDLVANPPKFIIGGLLPLDNPELIMSPPLQDLLKRRYTLRLIARGTLICNARGSQALFERND